MKENIEPSQSNCFYITLKNGKQAVLIVPCELSPSEKDRLKNMIDLIWEDADSA